MANVWIFNNRMSKMKIIAMFYRGYSIGNSENLNSTNNGCENECTLFEILTQNVKCLLKTDLNVQEMHNLENSINN